MDNCPLGMVQVETHRLIKACEATIESIKLGREKLKKQYIQEILEEKLRVYNKSWFKRFKKEPTEEDAIYRYEHGDWYRSSHSVKHTYKNQEEACKKLLNAAKASYLPYIWVSTESISYCNL
jgi:cytoplasmic iron level regulating protein YaaA (DUF328/UPF0246 family)